MTQTTGIATASGQTVSTPDDRNSPPRPPLAFRVGIVGHRPNRLKQADARVLEGVMTDVLRAVREAVESVHRAEGSPYAADPPVLRAISPLAEGSDRLFAEAALELGYELCCILPFEQAQFEKDFEPGKALETSSLERFRALLAKATTRFELDGRRDDEGAAYGAGGRLVLRQSDLLVVVWDGERQGKVGGTEQTFDEARALGVPIVWIDAHSPHAWKLLKPGDRLPSAQPGERLTPAAQIAMDQVGEFVRSMLAPPPAAKPMREFPGPIASRSEHGERVGVTLDEFLGEHKPRVNLAVFWTFFRNVVGDGRPTFPGFGVPDFEKAVEKEWPRDRSTPVGRLVDDLRPYYAWPDKLAVCYSDAYRSAFVLAYLLAACAVGFALLPVAAGWLSGHHHVAVAIYGLAEMVTILLILWLVFRGRGRKWHDRWLDYRLCAEMTRHLRLVAPLGGGRPFPQLPPHLGEYGHPGTLWVTWHVRAVERKIGLPGVRVDGEYLAAALGHVKQVLESQIGFHETMYGRSGRIEHRLHLAGAVLLAATVVACAVHILPECTPCPTPPDWVPHVATFLCGFLPALGAAFAGISNQGEFRRVAKRSAAMKANLRAMLARALKLERRLQGAGPPAPGLDEVGDLADEAARLMVNEVLDWRVVFTDRPPAVPA